MRWILNMLHDLKYLIPWEVWYFGTLRSYRVFGSDSGMYLLNLRVHFGFHLKPKPKPSCSGLF